MSAVWKNYQMSQSDDPAAARPASLDEARQNRERRARIQTALRQGELIASSDVREGEYFMMMHRAIMRALGRANQLTAKQRQFLTVLMEYSYGNQSRYAVTDLQEKRAPAITDWCAWLGDWPAKQVMNVRRELLALRVIELVEGNTAQLAINETWEQWDATVFQRSAPHRGVGRPKKPQTTSAADSPMTIGNSRITDTPELPQGNHRITGESFLNYPVVIQELPTTGDDARNGAGSSKRIRMEDGKKGRSRTETIVSGAGAPPASADVLAETAESPIATTTTRPPTNPESCPDGWPARAEGEKPLSYYPRAVEACKNKPAGAAYAAHVLLGVPRERTAIMRLSGVFNALAKIGRAQARWGLIATAIVKASSAPYDSDALDYVQKTAERLAREERDGKANTSQRPTRNPDYEPPKHYSRMLGADGKPLATTTLTSTSTSTSTGGPR